MPPCACAAPHARRSPTGGAWGAAHALALGGAALAQPGKMLRRERHERAGALAIGLELDLLDGHPAAPRFSKSGAASLASSSSCATIKLTLSVLLSSPHQSVAT